MPGVKNPQSDYDVPLSRQINNYAVPEIKRSFGNLMGIVIGTPIGAGIGELANCYASFSDLARGGVDMGASVALSVGLAKIIGDYFSRR